MCPDPEVPFALEATEKAKAVEDAELTGDVKPGVPTNNLLFMGVLEKFDPVSDTAVPTVATVGVMLEITGGARIFELTVNESTLVVEPAEVATDIGPVVVPGDTLATIWEAVDEITVAAVP